jgi:molybdate transport system substrate-binding protein
VPDVVAVPIINEIPVMLSREGGREMRRKVLSVVLLISLVLTACESSTPRASLGNVKLAVLAGGRLDEVFPQVGALFTKDHPGATFNFVYDTETNITAQIQQGAYADIFAGGYTDLADQLVSANKMDAYRVFATSPLVLITPTANGAGISTIQDLATKPIKLAIQVEEAPTGKLTRMVLEAVLGSDSSAVLGKVVSIETFPVDVMMKVESGEADGGFVLRSDLVRIGADVNVIALPVSAHAFAPFPIALVKATKNRVIAQQFADFVLTAPAQALLKEVGFDPPPASSS